MPLGYKHADAPQEKSQEFLGVLRDMSLGGIYFKCQEPPTFSPGNIIEVNFSVPNYTNFTKKSKSFIFRGRGKVIRIEPPDSTAPYYGIAVEFLTPLA